MLLLEQRDFQHGGYAFNVLRALAYQLTLSLDTHIGHASRFQQQVCSRLRVGEHHHQSQAANRADLGCDTPGERCYYRQTLINVGICLAHAGMNSHAAILDRDDQAVLGPDNKAPPAVLPGVGQCIVGQFSGNDHKTTGVLNQFFDQILNSDQNTADGLVIEFRLVEGLQWLVSDAKKTLLEMRL